jgi:hypothetical protein
MNKPGVVEMGGLLNTLFCLVPPGTDLPFISDRNLDTTLCTFPGAYAVT